MSITTSTHPQANSQQQAIFASFKQRFEMEELDAAIGRLSHHMYACIYQGDYSGNVRVGESGSAVLDDAGSYCVELNAQEKENNAIVIKNSRKLFRSTMLN